MAGPTKRKPMVDALRVLSRKRVSTGRLREMLEAKGASRDDIETCIERLREWGYLNDLDFAVDILKYRLEECPIGRLRASHELYKRSFDKNVSEQAIVHVFGDLKEEDLAEKALAKRLNGKAWSSLKDKERERLARWLWGRGFNGEAVRVALYRISQDTLE